MLITDEMPVKTLAHYRRELDQLRRSIECAWACTNAGHSTGTASQLLAAGMLAHAVTHAEAVYNLFCLGYDNAAAIIVRSMAELAIDCAYIWTRDTEERARRYIRHAVAAAVKVAESLSDGEARITTMLRAPRGVLPAHVKSVADAKRWVKQEFGPKAEWTPVALPDRAKEAGVSPMYQMIYRLGCTEAHSNVAALPIFGPDPSSVVVKTGARLPDGAAWVIGASGALLFVLASVVEAGGADAARVSALADEWTVTANKKGG